MERFEQVKRSHGLIPRGAEVGLDASVGYTQSQLDKRIQSSTLNSQRLVFYVARNHGLEMSEALYAVLNRRHFTEAGVLNDRSLLVEALEEIGLTMESGLDKAIAFLDSGRGTDAILGMYETVTDKMGIHSIPTLIVDGTYVISGAQRSDQILQVLEKVMAEGASGTSGIFADIPLDSK